MNPTADHIARAVVTACALTGDDPIAVVGDRVTGARARHYAVHALAKVFPEANRTKLSEWVGCPGKGQYFWGNSTGQVAHPTSPGGPKRMVKWWSYDVFLAVVSAVENVGQTKSAEPMPKLKIDAGVTKIAKAVAKLESKLEHQTIVTRPPEQPRAPGPTYRPSPGGINPGKRALYEMLGEAVKNTAKLPKGD